MQEFLDKCKQGVNWLSIKGLPIPLFRNPRHQESSVTFTMLLVSFTVCVLSATGAVPAVDFDHCFDLFMAVSALYFGRNFQKKDTTSAVPAKVEK